MVPQPRQTATDGSPSLIRAVEEVFPNSPRQRCLGHKTRNVLDKVPDNTRVELKAMFQAAYYAPNQDVVDMIAAEVMDTYQDLYPSAMRSLQDNWDACIACSRCPAVHHKRIETTNLMERTFLEERCRTKVIPRFFYEKSCIRLVFVTLRRTSQRWQGVKMSEFERQQLKLGRRELGSLPDSTPDDVGLKVQRLAFCLMPPFLQEILDLPLGAVQVLAQRSSLLNARVRIMDSLSNGKRVRCMILVTRGKGGETRLAAAVLALAYWKRSRLRFGDHMFVLYQLAWPEP